MALAKFFIDQSAVMIGESVTLSPQESHHAVKVRRLQQGDAVMLLNGNGIKASGVIQHCDRRALTVDVESVVQSALPQRQVEVAVALPKGDRQKQMLDMLAQLGATSITPLLCDFSVSQYSDKVVPRWERTLLEACKQSENPFLPQIHAPQTPLEFVDAKVQLGAMNDRHLIYYADIEGVLPSTLTLSDSVERVSIMIGPEGGYSDAELSTLERKGVSKLRLSRYILRIETAAIAAVAAFVS